MLAATGLGRAGAIAPFDLTMHQGEVVGLAGLLGSGRTELARLLFGADRADSGAVTVEGRPVRLRSPRAAIAERHRLLLREPHGRGHRRRPDRAREHHPGPAGRPRLGAADPAPHQRRAGRPATSRRSTSARPTPTRSIRNLSGGNQQKVLLARWLITEPRAADPRRADPRHRRRRQGRDPEAGRRAGRRGHGRAVHLRRAGGGAAARHTDRRAARPAHGRRARQRADDVEEQVMRAHRERWRCPPMPADESRAGLTPRHALDRLFWPAGRPGRAAGVDIVAVDRASSSIRDRRTATCTAASSTSCNERHADVLVALGMTLVIATGGIDLSVGAVVAIAGAVACAARSAAAPTRRVGQRADRRRRSRPAGWRSCSGCGTASWSPCSASSRSSRR